MTISDCCYIMTDRVKVAVQCDNEPVVLAGPDQHLPKSCEACRNGLSKPDSCKKVEVPVFLDGTESYDPDNEKLNCTWSFICTPPTSILTSDDIKNRFTPVAFFSADALGEYVMELRCSDGCSDVRDMMISNVLCNAAPVAKAHQITHTLDCVNKFVTLDASESSDEDGDDLEFLWSFIHLPDGSRLGDHSITNRNGKVATFDPDTAGRYKLSVAVSDCCSVSTALTTVDVDCSHKPTAHAGEDITIVWDGVSTDEIEITGTYDDGDSDVVNMEWTFEGVAPGSLLTNADIKGSDTLTPTFVPDQYGMYALQFTVSDCCTSDQDYMFVNIECTDVTKASAGQDQMFRMGCGAEYPLTVESDGNLSTHTSYEWKVIRYNNYDVKRVDAGCDYEGYVNRRLYLDHAKLDNSNQPAMISWTFAARPPCSRLTDDAISRHRGLVASFVPDCDGTYKLEVSASDDLGTTTDFSMVRVYLPGNVLSSEMSAITQNLAPEMPAIIAMVTVLVATAGASAFILLNYRRRASRNGAGASDERSIML
eukprot:GFYU01019074.1.p1 GENE.GFYU01019074.1~~GFYU01019074.1.p1  ORF type:complete len:537 (+),score=202.35 GFYU01019074.1:343-1953(+)